MHPLKVISLERSDARRAEFRRHNSHLGYEFVDAIDGALLHPDVISRLGLFKPGLTYKSGAYGAALSHFRLWEDSVQAGRPLTVAEDDAIFRKDFAQTHAALLDGLPTDWDFVLWGWNLDSVLAMQMMPGLSSNMYFDYRPLLEKIEEFQTRTGHPQLFRRALSPGNTKIALRSTADQGATAKQAEPADLIAAHAWSAAEREPSGPACSRVKLPAAT